MNLNIPLLNQLATAAQLDLAAFNLEDEIGEALTKSRWARDRRYRKKQRAKQSARTSETTARLRAEMENA